jgi:hypothetical protein
MITIAWIVVILLALPIVVPVVWKGLQIIGVLLIAAWRTLLGMFGIGGGF